VVAYNALPWIEQCLDSVAGYETVVVDHGSTDRTVPFVREKFPAVRLVEQENRGLAAGWNRGIRETCELRNWRLWALNVRSNHVHSVVTANCHSKRVRAALKANATRTMRESGCWESERSPWSGGGSRRFIWTEQQLIEAIDYVLYGHGDELP